MNILNVKWNFVRRIEEHRSRARRSEHKVIIVLVHFRLYYGPFVGAKCKDLCDWLGYPRV